jgi:hypothetical protein
LAGWIAAVLTFWPWLQNPLAQGFWERLLRYSSGIFTRGLEFDVDLTSLGLVQVAVGVCIGLASLLVCYLVIRWAHQKDRLQSSKNQPWIQALVAFAFIVQVVITIIPRGYTIKRQLAPLWPYALLLFALFWPWRGRCHTLLAGALTLSLMGSLINITLVPKAQWREATAFITTHCQPNDIVLIEPSYMEIPFDYYDGGNTKREGLSYNTDTSKLGAFLEEYDRVWFISHTADNDPQQRTQNWLNEHAVLAGTAAYYRLQIRLYEPLSER